MASVLVLAEITHCTLERTYNFHYRLPTAPRAVPYAGSGLPFPNTQIYKSDQIGDPERDHSAQTAE
jgi:hypothetical protein